ncbi:hypothetical protein Tco_0878171 [Tanacetum coccineum]|uniref:Uncharacterized protein n=1 Tax=Tanacetum coccineum TaxID=301880 RepID=A0ABQ5BX62_9ASTR
MHGPYVRQMIPEPCDPDCEVSIAETFHEKTDEELTEKEDGKVRLSKFHEVSPPLNRGPYTLRINGQNYHRIGSLLPKEAIQPRDWCHSHNSINVELKLLGDKTKVRQYNKPTVSEVAALITNDFGDDAHILLWLEEHCKCSTTAKIDDIISAELPFQAEDPEGYKLWNENWEALSNYILPKKRKLFRYPELQLSDEQIQNYCLLEIQELLNGNGRDLSDFEDLP